ncbi:MAG: type II CRISPR RNA-guided endonuclease Cas9, partial [Paludibacteraceae bacterium]
MKKILGLDLGTNSIGWALVEQDFEKKEGNILGMGSRIIPMTQDVLDTFSGGKPLETQTAARTGYRGVRRIRERHLLRRERLHRVLNVLGFLPNHYASQIDFEKRMGQFLEETEPKLVYNNKEFIFKKSFDEMLADFKQSQPQLFYIKPNGKETKIPYDWTIYYLRKKALTQKILKEELAWIILNFNQKRGYYQLRGEDDETENPNKLVEFHSLKVVNVIADEKPNSKGDLWYSLQLENGWIYRRSSRTPLFDWKDKIRDFIVTTDLNDDGSFKTDKEGVEKRSFRAPSEDDWTLLKKKTEQEIDRSSKTVGDYIYDTLLQKPNQKIRGKLVRTIERKFYKDELKQILEKQIELQPELFTDDLYNDCVLELYRQNEAQQLVLSKRDFVHLFVEDIIFYQRPLKSQKSSIGNCTLEYHLHKDKDGNEIKEYLKSTPKSNPLYQEFRVWQWLFNLKIYNKADDTDVTVQLIKGVNGLENLFEFLMQQKEVNHKDVLKSLLTPNLKEQYPNAKPKAFENELNKEISKYRWNYVFDDSKEKEEEKSKKYPCNATGYEIRRRLEKVEKLPVNFLTPEIEQYLWHIIYSVTDKREYESALKSFANKYDLDKNSFVEEFKKFPPFKSEYGAYSEKAIKKLLPLMRLGKYWNENEITEAVKNRANSIKERLEHIEYDEKRIDKATDDEVLKGVLKSFIKQKNSHFTQGLQSYQASYMVYGRNSEAEIADKWTSIAELENYLKGFKQHSLRNPIVEQIVTETLRVVRDIWKHYGKGSENFFDEIHVELGREIKNTADDRKYMSEQVSANEATNLRIKALLIELKENSDGKLSVNDVRPYSPMQQDALRIYEEGVLNSDIELPEDILKISKTAQPSKLELQRYKLWLEQKYRSPYTGQIIPLGKLFTEEYQIEHIIPKSRYFDDSFNNKVICESAVNQLKNKLLGLEFIQKFYGYEVELGTNKTARIFTVDDYKDFVKQQYSKNKTKRRNLLLDEIPEQMITRQLNDTRYISKFISNLLSNIVRADNEDDGINSKNLIPGNGKITTVLKQDWGLNGVWNDLILPRFKRMNELTQTENFTSRNQEGHTIPTIPLGLSKGFQKKRIDHRHHAMDALVIACMTREHVNLLNNQSAKSEVSRYDLQNKLRNKEKESWFDKKENKHIERDVFKDFTKPWENFTVDAKHKLETIVVSFKQNLRVINKATNKYEKYKDGKKIKVEQQGINWAIR